MSLASFPLESIGLPKDMQDAANRANLTTSSILLTPLPKLADTLRCKVPFAQSLVRQVSKGVVPIPKRMDEVYEEEEGGPRNACAEHVPGEGNGLRMRADGIEETIEHGNENGNGNGSRGMKNGESSRRGKWLLTGDEGMDKCLGGGLRRGCLYEITGESAAGKSHLALTLALSSQLPALTSSPGGSLILTSERELSTDRLVQLAKSLLGTHEPHPDEDTAEERRVNRRVKGLLDNVLTNRVGDVDALEHALNYAIPAMLESRLNSSGKLTSTNETKPIRLIVLDSITALFRGGSANDEKPTAPSSLSLTERSKRLCSVADQLKSLAVTYDLVVLVINQVSDVFARQQRQLTPTSTPTSSFTQTQPFLGVPPPPPQTQHFDGIGAGPGAELIEDPPMIYASQARWFSGQSEGLNKEASLGIVWANAINVRIMLSRTGRRRLLHQEDLRPSKRRRRGDVQAEPQSHRQQQPPTPTSPIQDLGGIGIEVDDAKPTLIRKMHVVFSPFSPSGTVDYAITPSGVHSLPDSYKMLDITETVRKRRETERKAREKEREEQRRQVGLRPLDECEGERQREHEQEQEQEEQEEEFGDEVFDDFGELPAEFWEERYQSHPVEGVTAVGGSETRVVEAV
ncbi:hypothetical protein IAR55_006110 [Kwoniella newhampshirensis]|uniref:RecA family profile 1 domain-containing protein n=1 Tax=Kwoniella newhampshirensis TaxID=1651941 RepID=A0AAW0YUN1_9TREE